MTEYRYTVLYEPFPEGGYNVIVPAFPEICTFGDTLDEARAMAEDAIKCVIESMTKDHEPLPPDVTPADHDRGTACCARGSEQSRDREEADWPEYVANF